jgi:hypothetical protein
VQGGVNPFVLFVSFVVKEKPQKETKLTTKGTKDTKKGNITVLDRMTEDSYNQPQGSPLA